MRKERKSGKKCSDICLKSKHLIVKILMDWQIYADFL